MIKSVFGVFLILHGLVHLLYLSIAQKWINDPNIHWDSSSGIVSRLLNETQAATLATVMYGVAILLFITSGIVLLFDLTQLNPVLYVSIAFSTLTILLFWNGTLKHLDDQGFVGILINLVLLVLLLTKVIEI